jgi:hypothetical protein
MRAAVMDAVRDAREREAQPHGLHAFNPFRMLRTRRLAPLALAACLVVAGTGAALAAQPGGPLYAVRIWIETATLPAADQARADAETNRLDDRIGEAASGLQGGNGSAVAAALAEYRAEVQAALKAAGNDPTQLERLRAALGTHIVALQTLATTASTADAAAIQQAIDESLKALDRIAERVAPATRPTPRPTTHPGQP